MTHKGFMRWESRTALFTILITTETGMIWKVNKNFQTYCKLIFCQEDVCWSMLPVFLFIYIFAYSFIHFALG